MNRGSVHAGGAAGDPGVPSMRPRFMNRGSLDENGYSTRYMDSLQ